MMSLRPFTRRCAIPSGPIARSFSTSKSLYFHPTAPRYSDASYTYKKLEPALPRKIASTALAPDGSMFSHPPPEPGKDFNLVMIGAGVS